MKGRKRKQGTYNQEGSEESKRIFDLHEKEKEQQSQHFVNQLDELRKQHKRKKVEDKEIIRLNAEQAIYQEKKRKIIEEKKTNMTGDTAQEELNTDNQEILLSSEDTPVANTEETQDTSLDQTENLATRLNEETQPLEPDPSNLSFNNATDIKPATIEDQQDIQIEYSATGNNTLEPSPSNQSYNSESPKTNSLASESPQTNSLATDIKPSLPHNSSTDKTQSQHINSTKKTQISNNGANNSEETDSDPDYNDEDEGEHLKNATQLHQTARSSIDLKNRSMGGKTPRLPQNDPTPIAEVYPGKFQKLGLRPSPKKFVPYNEVPSKFKRKKSVSQKDEPIRIFMETWNQIRYCHINKQFIGRNVQKEEQELDIASIRKLDKDNLLKCLTNKEIKNSNSGSQTVWMDLPKLYKDYINQHSKDISDYEKECEFNWLKFKLSRNKELWGYRKSLEENNEIKMKNGNKKSIIEKKMSPMFSKYFFENETHGFIQKLENEPLKYHCWTGSSCPTSSVNIPSQSYNMETCVFSSIADVPMWGGGQAINFSIKEVRILVCFHH